MVSLITWGWLLLLGGCSTAALPTPASVVTPPAPTSTMPVTPIALSPTPAAPTLPPSTLTSTPTVTATPLPTATPTPTATPDPYAAYTIAALAGREYGGGQLEIVEELERTDHFARYLVRFPSDGLTIYGFMNVPHEGVKFPVALVLHGYIDPAVYQVQAYTTRYADALAEAGYFTIHPNFRNYPPSDPGPNPYRIGYAVDVLNLMAIIRQQSVADPTGPLRRADGEHIHLLGHSMGGGVALRVSVVQPEWVRATVLYASVSGDEAQNYARVLEWSAGRAGHFELAASPEALAAISPSRHLERLLAPVSIHHSDADDVVPIAWSDDLCAALQARHHLVECYTYHGAAHTFVGPWDDLFMERVIRFFRQY